MNSLVDGNITPETNFHQVSNKCWDGKIDKPDVSRLYAAIYSHSDKNVTLTTRTENGSIIVEEPVLLRNNNNRTDIGTENTWSTYRCSICGELGHNRTKFPKKQDIHVQMFANNKSSINENMTEVESILNAILKMYVLRQRRTRTWSMS